MPVQNDPSLERPAASRSLSTQSQTQLMRNLVDPVDEDGNTPDGAYQLLQQIALDVNPINSNLETYVLDTTGVITATKIIECPPDRRIAVLNIQASANGADIIKFQYREGGDALAPVFLAAAGSIANSFGKGFILKKGEALYYTNSQNVNHGLAIQYLIV